MSETDGLAAIARRVHRKAAAFAMAMTSIGYGTGSAEFFDTVSVRPEQRKVEIVARATFPTGRGSDVLREVNAHAAS